MYRRWLSQLLDESAFPLLVLAMAVSQIQISHPKNNTVHRRGQVAIELQANDRFPTNSEKDGSQSEEKAASHKESTHNK
jgi:hypothetical protein